MQGLLDCLQRNRCVQGYCMCQLLLRRASKTELCAQLLLLQHMSCRSLERCTTFQQLPTQAAEVSFVQVRRTAATKLAVCQHLLLNCMPHVNAPEHTSILVKTSACCWLQPSPPPVTPRAHELIVSSAALLPMVPLQAGGNVQAAKETGAQTHVCWS